MLNPVMKSLNTALQIKLIFASMRNVKNYVPNLMSIFGKAVIIAKLGFAVQSLATKY